MESVLSSVLFSIKTCFMRYDSPDSIAPERHTDLVKGQQFSLPIANLNMKQLNEATEKITNQSYLLKEFLKLLNWLEKTCEIYNIWHEKHFRSHHGITQTYYDRTDHHKVYFKNKTGERFVTLALVDRQTSKSFLLCCETSVEVHPKMDSPITVDELLSVEFEVYGQVQGCYFTKYCKELAEQLGLLGWVKNSKKGTIVGKIQGHKAAMDHMIDWLSTTGSPGCKIEKCDLLKTDHLLRPEYTDFSIRF